MPNYCKCGRRSSYGYENDVPVICSKCVTDPKMVNLRIPKCRHPYCKVSASYGPSNIPNSRFSCQTHRLDGYKLMTGHKCTQCDVHASFGTDETGPIHCASHKEPNDKRLINSRICKCGKIASWRLQYKIGMAAELKIPTHCFKCKRPDMECIYNKKCVFSGCKNKKEFIKGVANEYCDEHVVDKLPAICIQEGCDKLILTSYDMCIKHRNEKYGTEKSLKAKSSYSLKDILKDFLK
jgi:hypothetical protein